MEYDSGKAFDLLKASKLFEYDWVSHLPTPNLLKDEFCPPVLCMS